MAFKKRSAVRFRLVPPFVRLLASMETAKFLTTATTACPQYCDAPAPANTAPNGAYRDRWSLCNAFRTRCAPDRGDGCTHPSSYLAPQRSRSTHLRSCRAGCRRCRSGLEMTEPFFEEMLKQ